MAPEQEGHLLSALARERHHWKLSRARCRGERGNHRSRPRQPGGGQMSQTRLQSFLEANVSTAIGFGISWLATPFVLAAFGFTVGAAKALGITLVFTVISIIRGYVVRRFFNRMEVRR
ncbi:hypothetical protein SNK04_014424 [Fusarium graminearum]